MKGEKLRENILGFMYAERLKSALIIAGQLLDVLPDLNEGERSGGLKMFGSFVRGVGNEMRLAANVMGGVGLGWSQRISQPDGRLCSAGTIGGRTARVESDLEPCNCTGCQYHDLTEESRSSLSDRRG